LNGYNGTISRKCIQDGSNGNWSSIIGSCDGISFIIQLFKKKHKNGKKKKIIKK